MGVAVLANSRPFESLMVALPLLIGLIWNARNRLTPILMPGMIILGLVGTWMGYYNYRVTGSPLQMPFAEYTAQYDVYPKFWFQPLRPLPIYRNRSQRWVHTDFEKGQYEQLRTWKGFFGIAPLRAAGLISDNLKLAVLLIPFAVSFFLWRDVRIRWAFIPVGGLLIGLWGENFDLPHYSAPVFGVLLLFVVKGMAQLWRHQSSSRLGAKIVISVLIGFVTGAGMCIAQGVSRDTQIVQQQDLVNLQPALQSGRHLIFVDYGPMTEMASGFANEYVYNAADIAGSRIIWARCFGPDSDEKVARHYAGRAVWMLNVGKTLNLTPYLEQEHVPAGLR